MWLCPVCSGRLSKSDNTYRCSAGHCFDCGRSGYVNLLPSNRKHGKMPGDNQQMVTARQRFLSAGYYQPLADRLAKAVSDYISSGNLLDIGCGEGYYTQAVADACGNAVSVWGIDISKIALAKAAKRCPSGSFAVASAFHLPVPDHSCTAVLNLFAPFCNEEVQRVLHRHGLLMMAIPEKEHLWELKQAVYDQPYKNQVKPFALEGFNLMETEEIQYPFTLPSGEMIQNLFMMTPYYYKTGAADQQKLERLDSLTVTAHFRVLVYRLAD